jgi:hypothetical protein
MASTLSLISLLIALAAFVFSFLAYRMRNRPFVGVKSLSVSPLSHNGETELAIEIQNVGQVPAIKVSIKVNDSGGLFENRDFFLGAIFPGQSASAWIPVPHAFTYAPDNALSHLAPISPKESQSTGLGDDAQEYVDVYPEGYDAGLVTCSITYEEPLLLGFVPARAFHTVQPFRVEHGGRSQPSRSKQAEIT